MKKVTIQDIARVSGVSKSTVSRVLNGKVAVNPEKEKAVHKAIERLGFQPNILAQSLASGRSSTVGVLTQMIGSPFYDAISQGLIAAFSGTGYSPIFADGRWHQSEQRDALKTLVGRRVDGVIVIGGTISSLQISEITRELPVLLVARKCDAGDLRSFSIDNDLGAYIATRHLVSNGHRSIAMIKGLADHADAKARLEGYRRALADSGLPFDERLVVEGDFSAVSGVNAVEQLVQRKVSFTAIFAANDLTAYGARLALSRVSKRVPEDIAIIGFDDQMESSFTTPPLSSVRQPAREMGERAAGAILALIEGKPFDSVLLEPELKVRESSDFNRQQDR
ncbi:LacI family DNA-binding transcriptional regulator [Rubripirellula sp.]|jgi:LacI family transcriptional regulator|nr:LacI family DNA-binding transcriptional regulator [Rubripirellula sp.]